MADRVARIAFLLLLFAAVAYLAWSNRRYELDDALIYYRYLQNALDGNGLVYNLGERFNALTSPLFTYVSLLTCGVFGSIQRTMMAQSAIFHWATLATLTSIFAKHEMRWPFVALGAGLIAVSRYFYSLYGMETPLFLLLCAACLRLHDTGRTFWLGIACALLLLTRGEGLFLVLALITAHLVRRRPVPPLRHFLVPGALIGANLVFNRLYYGSFLPHTLTAKIDQGRSGLWGEWPLFLKAGYQIEYFAHSVVLLTILVSLAVLGIVRLGRRETNFVVLGFLVALTAFYLALNVPYYHWYYAPYYAFGFMYAGLGAAWLFDAARRLKAPLAVQAAGVAIALLCVGLLVVSANSTLSQPVSESQRQRVYPAIGKWLSQNTPADATIAMVEIGIIGYYCDRRVVDILGLVSPGNSASLGQRRFADWVDRYQPDFVLVHDPLWRYEIGIEEPVRRGEYRKRKPFRFRGFALLARTD